MPRPAAVLPPPSALAQRGLTLGEMLVVIAIVAALASVAWGRYATLARSEADRLVRVQLDQITQALRAFHADTGHWPGEGPFALAPAGSIESPNAGGGYDCTGIPSDGGLSARAGLPELHLPGGAVDLEAWRENWFAHPANLGQLFTRPLLCTNHPLGRLMYWDAEARRGWRGPYLDPTKLLRVDAGHDGAGLEQAPVQRNLPNVPAGAPLPPLPPCATAAAAECAFRWRSVDSLSAGYDAARDQFSALGRPLFYFRPTATTPARIAHAGADGRFGGFALATPCQPDLSAARGADDLVLCLD
jgi:prepilin-type N-terminal cleavage/methylation domain-containing protein